MRWLCIVIKTIEALPLFLLFYFLQTRHCQHSNHIYGNMFVCLIEKGALVFIYFSLISALTSVIVLLASTSNGQDKEDRQLYTIVKCPFQAQSGIIITDYK